MILSPIGDIRVVVKTSGMHAEEQGTQRAKHNSHFYENQG